MDYILLTNKIGNSYLDLVINKTEHFVLADLNMVWDEITNSNVRYSDYDDDCLFKFKLTSDGIKYYISDTENDFNVPESEESWNEPQWSIHEIYQLLEGLEYINYRT